MDLKINDCCHGFTILKSQWIEEIHCHSYEMIHKKSGAKLLYMKTDDDNKVFSITFRTPPPNSTGVPHILEHSVLCGSRKFPLKEPFVELVKGSLNTFLNAMTFPDKTMYPIASRNNKDFRNLMDVYLDAVFFPNMVTDKGILMQEGWHYELESPEAPLTYKGVVYNEMKGVYSSADAILEASMMKTLFPHTAYGVDSGGDPTHIPELTFEQFVDFYKMYYHPSNSYIYLYGNMDIEDTLRFIDEEYLSHFEKMEIDSEIAAEPAFAEPVKTTVPYGISSEESEQGKTLHNLAYVINDGLDPVVALGFEVLNYALLGTASSPLRRAVIDAGLGKDVNGAYQTGLLQPVWSITVNGAESDTQGELCELIKKELIRLVERGIDRQVVEGALNRIEFILRENDFAGRPKGLMYNVTCLETWLYGKDPISNLSYEPAIKKIRQNIEQGFFEMLIEKYILGNSHWAAVSAIPQKGVLEAKEAETAEALAAYKATLLPEEIEELVRQTKALKDRQAAPDSEEALATIPLLRKDDLKREIETISMHTEKYKEVLLHHVPEFSNGVVYMNTYFDLKCLDKEEIPYAFLLGDILGDMDTENFSYHDLTNFINLHTGGFKSSVTSFSYQEDTAAYTPVFQIKAKVLRSNITKMLQIFRELTTGAIFSDIKRLTELLEELKAQWDVDVFRKGQDIVSRRLLAYFSPAGAFMEQGELSFYEFIAQQNRDLKTNVPKVAEKLAQVAAKIFTKANLQIQVIAEDEDKRVLAGELDQWLSIMPMGVKGTSLFAFDADERNEGIMTSGKVQYVAAGGNFCKYGYSYTGSYAVLDTIMRYDYLWTKIRVQGGAYGAFSTFTRNGNILFCSYRDPNVAETFDVYRKLADYVENFTVSEREMTKYLIGTMSRLDMPLTAWMKGDKAMAMYFGGITNEQLQKERDQVLQTTAEDIRALAPAIRAALSDNFVCAMGNEQKLKENNTCFGMLISLPQ